MRARLDGHAHMPENRLMESNEPIIEHLVRVLNEHKGIWPKIAEETGVHYDKIAKIAQRRRVNPGLQDTQKLLNWCVAREEMVAKLQRAASA
jgi:hypothetical protein